MHPYASFALIAAVNSQALTAYVPFIMARGVGSIGIAPNLARVVASFTSFSSIENGSAADAEASLISLSSKYLDGLTLGLSVPLANTTQLSFYVSPRLMYSSSLPPTQSGWDAGSKLETLLGETSLVTNVSSLATSLSGSIESIAFDADQASRRHAYQKSLRLATIDAQSRANAMAVGLGVAVGSPLSIADEDMPYMPFPSVRMLTMTSHESTSNGLADQGQLEINARVTATFSMLFSSNRRR